MELLDFYRIVKNPLKSDEIIKQLVRCYGKNSKDLYSSIISMENPAYIKYNTKEGKRSIDKINIYLMKLWKKNINSFPTAMLTPTEQKIKEIINKYNMVYTPEIVNEIMTRINSVENNTNNVLPLHYDKTNNWQYVKSDDYNLFDNTFANNNTEHNIYINVNQKYLDKLCIPFIKECQKRNIPYSLKFNIAENCNDTIVVYSDTKHLLEHTKILNDIINESSLLKDNIEQPSILKGRLGSYLGYGSQSKANEVSYSKKRTNLITEAITEYYKSCFDSIKTNEDFYQKLIKNLYTLVVNEMKKYIKKNPNTKRATLYRNHINNSDVIYKNILSLLKNYSISEKSKQLVEEATKKIVLDEILSNKKHIENIRTQINAKCRENAIDYNSFCFDMPTIRDMLAEVKPYQREKLLRKSK